MRILRGDNMNVDFEYPIELSKEQKQRFFNFLRDKFYFVSEEETEYFRTKRMGESLFMKEWAPEELTLLFKIDVVNDEVSKKLGRTWMSIDMKRGMFIPEILAEAKKKGLDIYKIDIKKFIEEFLKEHKEELLRKSQQRKDERKELNDLKKERDTLKNDIPKDKQVGLQIGIVKQDDIDKKEAKLKRVEERIKELENVYVSRSDRR